MAKLLRRRIALAILRLFALKLRWNIVTLWLAKWVYRLATSIALLKTIIWVGHKSAPENGQNLRKKFNAPALNTTIKVTRQITRHIKERINWGIIPNQWEFDYLPV
ncbi:hypothetical protein [Corynebacterium striatum]|uniref:hypothetical protein n=1 Tax=Corynebacterium striatum TaxID=43770 RepID=UPI001F428122|nr:hypothetical protein [Corynebacterium striatum]